jgi:DNA-binding beta-propeller fold protein YncE
MYAKDLRAAGVRLRLCAASANLVTLERVKMLAASLGLLLATHAVAAESHAPLTLIRSIPLENVRGRIAQLALDEVGQRLFVAAADDDEIEVIDLKEGRLASRIGGFSEPQGLAWIAPLQQLVAADGGDGRVAWLRGETFETVSQAPLEGADRVRFDPDAKLVYVVFGHGGLAAFDAATAKPVGRIELKGHPEAFSFDPGSTRLFVNLPAARQIAVVDRLDWSLASLWDVSSSRNFPMAFDPNSDRLLVATRRPPRLLVLDAKTGREVGAAEACADADGLWLDAAQSRAYLSCGEGITEVFQTNDSDHYERLERLPTARSARTSLFDPGARRFYVAVPSSIGRSAEILVFRAD